MVANLAGGAANHGRLLLSLLLPDLAEAQVRDFQGPIGTLLPQAKR